jgi:hypothetical protein
LLNVLQRLQSPHAPFPRPLLLWSPTHEAEAGLPDIGQPTGNMVALCRMLHLPHPLGLVGWGLMTCHRNLETPLPCDFTLAVLTSFPLGADPCVQREGHLGASPSLSCFLGPKLFQSVTMDTRLSQACLLPVASRGGSPGPFPGWLSTCLGPPPTCLCPGALHRLLSSPLHSYGPPLLLQESRDTICPCGQATKF